MRSVHLVLVFMLLVAGALDARADLLLWDNFLTPRPADDGGVDRHSYFTCERDATIEDSWVVDDARFNVPVVLDAIKWAGGRLPAYPYTVEVMVLKEEDNTLAEWPGFPLGLSSYQVTGTFGTFYGYQVYNGYVELPPTSLPAGHYYFGVRLVSIPPGEGDGRNVALTTGFGTINGDSMGFVRVPPFGYPDWIPVDQFPGETPTDFAFQLYGIPEPASVPLLALGPILSRRRH